MTKNILITQSLQNDFVKLIGKHEPLPNLLHIGYKESYRLLGEGCDGPISQFINWVQGSSKIEIIHIRDWHDGSDPMQDNHFKHFGPHCLSDDSGSDFIFEYDKAHERTTVIDSPSLNDFINTNLDKILEPYKDEPVNVSIVGVWTEAKVKFLCYELITRYPSFTIGVCSALTAGSNRTEHLYALDYLKRILGVKVFHSIQDFSQFLDGAKPFNEKLNYSDHLEVPKDLNLDGTSLVLIKYLFQNCKSISVDVLEGGFSGNAVLRIKGIDKLGLETVPHVVKIGPSDDMAAERFSFEQVEEVLGNNAPAITSFAEFKGKGAIKYRYASLYGEKSKTFQKIYEVDYQQNRIKHILAEVFGNQLGRFYKAAKIESVNLFDYYCFSSMYAERTELLVTALVGCSAEGGRIKLEGQVLPNIAFFYKHQLDEVKDKISNESMQSYVHGDLNGANILVDEHDNPWLIDFFHTHKGHVLKDLIKFENDLLFIWTKINDLVAYQKMTKVIDVLIGHDDLSKLPKLEGLASTDTSELNKCIVTILQLRSYYAALIKTLRDPIQYRIAALRYCVHTMTFEECNLWQKKLALYMACQLSEKLFSSIQGKSDLRIDWIAPKKIGCKLGLTILPGRQDRKRSLVADIESIKKDKVTSVYCLAEQWELDYYGVSKLIENYEQAGLVGCHYPVVDQKTLSQEETHLLIKEIQPMIEKGQSVLLHCIGGIGRSGTLAACYLKQEGFSAMDAIARIRKDRSPRSIENIYQENFIHNYVCH